MRLEKASDKDLVALMRWFSSEAETIAWAGFGFRFPFDALSFCEDVGLDTRHSFVYRDNGRLLGFGQVYDKHGRGHLARIAVTPDARGRGIGSRLAQALAEKAFELLGCTEHSLFVLRDNDAAIRCYRKLGFCETANPDAAGSERDYLYMVRRETPA